MNAKRRAELSHACCRQSLRPRKSPARTRAGARARHRTERHCSARFASSACCATSISRCYLPMRYEDETRSSGSADAPDGDMAQVEAVVTDSEIVFRPRRQLIVTRRRRQRHAASCASSISTVADRSSWRSARGCACAAKCAADSSGTQMVHPAVKAARHSVAGRADAGLSDHGRRVAGVSAQGDRQRVVAHRCRSCCRDARAGDLQPLGACRTCVAALRLAAPPAPDVDEAALVDRTHPAWRADQVRRIAGAAVVAEARARRARAAQRGAGHAAARWPERALPARLLKPRCRFALTGAQQRVGRRDRARSDAAVIRCSACCRAMSAAARPSSPRWRRRRRSTPATRPR